MERRQDLAGRRIVIDARRIGGMPGTNAITITDTAERIEAAGRLISMIDKARPEVLIDVELLEIVKPDAK